MRKKMSRVDRNEILQFSGESNNRGILMKLALGESYREKDVVFASTFQFPPAYACVADDGSVQVNPENVKEIWDNVQKEGINEAKLAARLSKILFIVGLIGVFSMFFLLVNYNYLACLCWSIGMICLGSSRITPLILGCVKRIRGDKRFRQLCRFHAAEHAAINAYYDLKRAPTMEEIKNYSNYAYNCSIAAAVKQSWVFIGIGICRLLPDLWCLIPFIIYFLVSIWADQVNYFFTEVGYLEEPTDFEYDVAIQAMNAAIKNKEKIDAEIMDVFDNASCINVVMGVVKGEDGKPEPVISIHIGEPEDVQEE